MNETLKSVIIAVVVVAIGIFVFHNKIAGKIASENGEYFDIPSVGTNESYEEYEKSFKTYESEYGFSFKYPPHLKITITPNKESNWIVIEAPAESEEDMSAIVISIGDNSEKLTPEEWFLSGGGYSEKENGEYHKTTIGGQEAVYTDGGMWSVVNTPDNKYRLSIASLVHGDGNILFSEMGTIVESITFKKK